MERRVASDVDPDSVMDQQARPSSEAAEEASQVVHEDALRSLKNKRKAKLEQLLRQRSKIHQFMDEDCYSVVEDRMLPAFYQLLKELCDINDSLKETYQERKLEDDMEIDQDWFDTRLSALRGRGDDIACRLTEVRQRREEARKANESVAPEDSVSVASTRRSRKSRTSSVTSSATKACLKAEIERAELLARAEALKQRHAIEQEEARLRALRVQEEAKFKAEKEELEMNAALAAAKARSQIMSKRAGLTESRGPNVGTDDFHLSQAKTTYAGEEVPVVGSVAVQIERAREEAVKGYRLGYSTDYSGEVTTGARGCDTKARAVKQLPGSMFSGAQCQTDRTEVPDKQLRVYTNPPQAIPIFSGDPLDYDVFIKAFENSVKNSGGDDSQRLYLLHQHTRGQPKEILILQDIHERIGHGGRNHVLSTLRQRYWIPNAISAIRKILSSCRTCRRLHGATGRQQMADLPLSRVLPDEPPFTRTGVDCFGPFTIKRGRTTAKRYGVIFTCMATRAVHIEVAASLDTDSFINALRRFIARRGQVLEIHSDNGTNFVGAERELKRSLEEWNMSKIENRLTQSGIKWMFNPPSASHFGGVWERLIRSVRKVLSATLKDQSLDEEGLQTLLCEVEAILNSRPITTPSDDPNDLEALTPNHLLLLKTQPSIPQGVFQEDDLYSRRRWRQVQYMADLFWKRWVKEYLPELQRRQKWTHAKRNFVPGDIVLIVDESAPRNSWVIGRIIHAIQDERGLVRQVRIKTRTNEFDRPITKVCLLQESE
ncbi:hypothetical protein Q8A73_024345 [Channa argus]|nr:hypothetical protein Q8A73_024345 [Channa argus]